MMVREGKLSQDLDRPSLAIFKENEVLFRKHGSIELLQHHLIILMEIGSTEPQLRRIPMMEFVRSV